MTEGWTDRWMDEWKGCRGRDRDEWMMMIRQVAAALTEVGKLPRQRHFARMRERQKERATARKGDRQDEC